jgi:hypothetical protein
MTIMDESTKNATSQENKSKNSGHRATNSGYCLKCGYRLSVCGRPFTTDIQCPKCGTVNSYVQSYQPVTVKTAVEEFEVIVAA